LVSGPIRTHGLIYVRSNSIGGDRWVKDLVATNGYRALIVEGIHGMTGRRKYKNLMKKSSYFLNYKFYMDCHDTKPGSLVLRSQDLTA
jgi:hypothetical protein